MAKKRLYVAYGSNLNIEQMKHRCPTAKLVGTGTLADHELQFKGMPGSSFATIAPSKGGIVPVAVWQLRPLDERNLDRYEGYPSHYFKQDLPVKMNDGTEVTAMVYIMDLKQDFGAPSQSYYDTVFDGYMDCDLDVDVLNEAVRKSVEKYAAAITDRIGSLADHSRQMSLFDFDEDEYTDHSGEDFDENEVEPFIPTQ